MKKLFLYQILLLIVGISLISCSDESQTESNSDIKLKSSVITAADVEPVGIMHNGLLEKLYKGYTVDMPKAEDTQQYAIDLYTKEIEALKITPEFIDIDTNTMKWNMTNFNPNDNSYINDKSFYKSDSIVNLLTENEKYYLDDLYEVVVNDTTATVEESISKIQDIERLISEDSFKEEQLITLYSATSIAKHSLQYWNDNLDKWSDLADRNDTSGIVSRGSGQAGRNFRLVAGADIAGGIGMAARTWMLNMVPGAGQGSYFTAIMTGAVGTSTAMAIGIIGKSYFSDWF